MIMSPKPVLLPFDKSQPEISAAAIAASTVPIAATGVFWILRARRISTSAVPIRISSGVSRARSDAANIMALLRRPGAGPQGYEDRREWPRDLVQDRW